MVDRKDVKITKVYLLPGTMCNEKLWQMIIPKFRADVEFVSVDFPINKSCEHIVEYLNESIDEEKINLIGFSLGGYIAANFACKYPHRISKLLLISNTPCSLTSSELKQRMGNLSLINQFGYSGMTSKVAKYLLDDVVDLTVEQAKSYNRNIEKLIEMDNDLGEAVFKSQLQYTSERIDLLDGLINLPLKITFIYSERDPLINFQWLTKFAEESHQYNFKAIKGKGHMLPLEKPDGLVEHISDWLY